MKTYVHAKMCTWMLFIMVKKWKQYKYSLADEINKWYIHTMELLYYNTMEWSTNIYYAQMKLENIVLYEKRPDTKKSCVTYDSIYIKCQTRKCNFNGY